MPGTPAEQVKEKLDIVEFLRGYLTLTPAGKNFKALCPFHKEKTPSFMVSPDRQSWHCFGCGIGGDVFSFLMRHESLEFGEALRVLAEKAGVELRRANPAEYKFAGLLYDINTAAKNFFRAQLTESREAQAYLASRKLAQAMIEEFELGWAPQNPEALNLHLMNTGYAPEDIVRAGLAFKTERGMQIDRFRGRIMFPIHDHFGKVAGFTGRILPQYDTGEMGKYVNSPETPIFTKSKLLYGFWKTKQAIRESSSVFLVEGQMDFLATWQAGVKNVVATSGTAATADHLRALARVAEELIVSFDSDEAGASAAERVIDLADAADLAVKVVTLKDFKDLAEVAEKDPALLREAVKNARPAPEFYFDRYLPADVPDRRNRAFLKSLRTVIGKIKHIASAVQRDFWMKELARRTGIGERVLLEEGEKIAAKSSASPGAREEEKTSATEERQSISRWDLLSERLVGAAFAKSNFAMIGEHIPYLAPDYRVVLELLERGEKRASDQSLDARLHGALLKAEDLPLAEIENVKANLFAEYVKERRRQLTDAVRRAELEKNEAALRSALEEIHRLPVV